jgi:hypothetical protein
MTAVRIPEEWLVAFRDAFNAFKERQYDNLTGRINDGLTAAFAADEATGWVRINLNDDWLDPVLAAQIKRVHERQQL